MSQAHKILERVQEDKRRRIQHSASDYESSAAGTHETMQNVGKVGGMDFRQENEGSEGSMNSTKKEAAIACGC